MISLIFYVSMHDVYLEMDDKAGDDEWQSVMKTSYARKLNSEWYRSQSIRQNKM